jgi:hypothetical protein
MQRSSSSFVGRVIGAIRLDPATYEEVEHDVVAFLAMVVVLVIVATVFGLSFVALDSLTQRPA